MFSFKFNLSLVKLLSNLKRREDRSVFEVSGKLTFDYLLTVYLDKLDSLENKSVLRTLLITAYTRICQRKEKLDVI